MLEIQVIGFTCRKSFTPAGSDSISRVLNNALGLLTSTWVLRQLTEPTTTAVLLRAKPECSSAPAVLIEARYLQKESC